MSKKKTQGEFLLQAKAKHGNTYDYSKTQYVNNFTYLTVTCREHGDFKIKPNNHLKGDGCPICRYRKLKRPVCGFGINDLDDITTNDLAYQHWRGMIKRCYDERMLMKSPQYRGCSVCEEWRYFSNFKRWFSQHYVDGWALDKDVMIKGNRVYSPETCCCIPITINSVFASLKSRNKGLPLGVCYVGRLNKYRVDMAKDGKQLYFGLFDTKEEAFRIYKEQKEKHLKELADRYKEELAPVVYDAIYGYEVEIID